MVISNVAPTNGPCYKRSVAVPSAIAGILLFAPSLRLAAQGPIAPASDNCSSRDLIQTAAVGPYLFKAYRNTVTGNGCLEVVESHRGGKMIGRFIPKVVFRSTLDGMGEFSLGQPKDPTHDIPKIENGDDITGRSRANMIVTNWTDGARCCFVHYVFEVDPALWLLARIDDGDGDGAHFADLDGNKHYYYVGNDWTFSYPAFAGSSAPAVILRFVDDPKGPSYRLAMDKMQQPQPTPAEWKKAVRDAGNDLGEPGNFEDGHGSELSKNMVNLIYTGNSDLAWKLVEQACPPAPRQG
ncbi:MAG: hypothetical protein ABSF28_12595 [Terracidiphilus sp.]